MSGPTRIANLPATGRDKVSGQSAQALEGSVARFKTEGSDAIYAAASTWRDEALRRNGSILSPQREIWTLSNLSQIMPRLQQDPIQGSDYKKSLAAQLSGAPTQQVQLYVEALYFYFLPTRATLGKTKRALLEFVRAFAPGVPAVPPALNDVLDHGLYDPGGHYNIGRADMLRYIVATAQRVKELTEAQRAALLSDPWAWREFLYSVEIRHVHQMRESFLHLLFPDTFERIVAGDHKERIVKTFGSLVRSPQATVDQKIFEIREGLQREYGSEFDFYEPRVRARWYPDAESRQPSPLPVSSERKTPGTEEGPTTTTALAEVCDRIADALTERGQVILYGPPGTGKTYTSLRFSAWWLGKKLGLDNPEAVLTDQYDSHLRRLDKELSQTPRRVWLVVANPRQWSWDRLVAQGTVEFRYGRMYRNYALVRPNDIVIGYQSTPDKRIAMVAQVVEGLHESADRTLDEKRAITLRAVRTVHNGPTYEDLRLEARLVTSEPIRLHMQGTLFALTQDESSVLFALIAERDSDTTNLDLGEGGVTPLTRVTFHPSYSYEDFVEGFRPMEAGNGQLALRLTDGIFKRVCDEALANPTKPYLLVIDEVNRGNLPRIFGELITLLERDKRGLTVVLPQSHEVFAIPPNVYVLGTMNTADRSIRLLDAAIRRRFAFEELMPQPELLRGQFVGDLDLEGFLRELNHRIARTVGREKQVGHSYLLGIERLPDPPHEFARRFRQEILPLLQEYAYDDYDALAGLIGDEIVDRSEKSLRSEVLADSDLLITALDRALQAPATQTSLP
jgi:hypothetical protein